MDSCIILQPAKVIPERPFSHPQASATDVDAMQAMIAALRALLDRSTEPPPGYLDRQEANGFTQRVAVPNWSALRRHQRPVAVGFFGQLRPEVDPAPIHDLEEGLIDQLDNVPGVLAYQDRFGNGQDYGRLVLLRSERAKVRWRNNALHSRAVHLSQRHYVSVRLHNGMLPGGLSGDNDLTLIRTKYYDFNNGDLWRAVREF